MTKRAKTTPASNAGSFAPTQRNESTGIDLGVPAPVPPGLLKPVKCRKCRGTGDYQYASGVVGACAPCTGLGVVEGDRARIAHSKARAAAMDSFYRLTVGNHKVAWAVDDLRRNEPERFEKALASYMAGRPDLSDALLAHYAEKNPSLPPSEIAKDWATFDNLPDVAQEALLHRDPDAADSPLEWQFARVPASLVTERIMSADPALADDFGTFEAYHDWYMTQGNVPDHGGSVWPSFEAADGSGTYLEDGERWFHAYFARGLSYVPIMRTRKEPS